MEVFWQRWNKWRMKPLFLIMIRILFIGSLFFLTFSIFLHQKLHILSRQPFQQGGLRSLPAVNYNDITFTPRLLSRNIELDNPQRGPQYAGDEAPPPNWPLTDRYKRWCWGDLEPQQEQYNFALIDKQLEAAKKAGYTFGFRIMPSDPGNRSRAACLPSYLASVSYNSQRYLDAARALFTALGQHYDHDPRLGWLDMSLYGCWGEWNESCGEEQMSSDFRQQLIDIQYQAFPDKRFLMLTDHEDSLDYALAAPRTYPTGIRADCLGRQGIGGAQAHLDMLSQRWIKAPIYFEYCGQADFQQASKDIQAYHASAIGDGDGNINAYGIYNHQQQAFMKQNYQLSGYRFVLNSISLPKKLVPGGTFTATTSWSNNNVAPAYHPWNIMLQLRDPANHVLWQEKSALDLQTLLPGAAKTNTDNFSLPTTLPIGTYTLTLQISDPQRYYQPLELAIAGMQKDRSYVLGSVTVTA
jgi:hypothetical protein